VLFCETVDELLDWIEGFKIFFEKKTQKLLKKFIQNETSLNSSNHIMNDIRLSNLYKDKESQIKFSNLIIMQELCINIIQENNKGLSGRKENDKIIYPLLKISGYNINIFSESYQNHERNRLEMEYKLISLNKISVLFDIYHQKLKSYKIKEIQSLTKKKEEKIKKEVTKIKEEEFDDWTIEVQIQPTKISNNAINKENLRKEISKNNSSKLNESDLKINKSSKMKLYDEKDLSIIDRYEDDIRSSLYHPKTTQRNTEIESNIEFNDKEISSRLDVKRDKSLELYEELAEIDNQNMLDNKSFQTIHEKANKQKIDQKLSTNEKPEINIDLKEEKKIKVKNSTKEEENSTINKFNERDSIISDKFQKEQIKLEMNELNIDDYFKFDSISRIDMSNYNTKKAEENKNILNFNSKNTLDSTMKLSQKLNSNKFDLSITSFSEKNFSVMSSPKFGNISIITQKMNKVDKIDDWKEFVRINPDKKKQKN